MDTRTVIFDFYGPRAGPAAPARSIIDLMLALGVNIPADAAERWDIDHQDGVLHEEASISEAAYEEWVAKRWHGMLDDCGVAADRRDGIVGAIRAQIASFRVRAFPESQAVLTELRRRGLQLGICSNWHWDLDTYIDQAGLTGLVDLALTSAQIGARKDHPLIYDRTLAALNADAATTVFVGDSWAPDVLGPIRAGMRAVHVVRDDRPAPELPAGAVRVRDLTEMLPHL
ncbi:MAG TPA: HAD family hydrolase [Miltoncostaeales bacterium]|nr:HAD family hydrolase [Miltoncostaeales bacterium]